MFKNFIEGACPRTPLENAWFATFVGFHAKKWSTFEEFYAKPKKRSTFVGFHVEKRSTFEEFYAKPQKKVHFCLISH